jgi:hypothetical protein
VGLTPLPRSPRRSRRRRQSTPLDIKPLFWAVRWADWFEARGVYVPGEDSRSLSTLRDFGWLIAGWLIVVSVFVVLFAIVS